MSKVKAKRVKSNKKTSRSLPWGKFLIVAFIILTAWIIYLDAGVREKFEGKRWQVPAQVYAQPLELYAGMPLPQKKLIAAIEQLGYSRSSAAQSPGEFTVSGNELTVHVRSFRFPEQYQKAEKFIIRFNGTGVASIRHGGVDADWLRFDPMRIAGIYPLSGEDRVLVSLAEVPAALVKALLAVEDRNFPSHWGVSPAAIGRAFWVNLNAGGVVQGGSTITQQLVKNFYLNDKQTLWRKVNEAVMSLLLELHYSKNEILETYLNEVFLGQAGKRAIHGFGQGSLFYFGKSLPDLSVDQMALLVGLVKGPSYYEPRRHPERAKTRRNLVLGVMAEQTLLTNEQMTELVRKPLAVVAGSQSSADRYPGFLALVRKQLAEEYSADVLSSEGLRIFTTLDPVVQLAAEDALVKTADYLQGTSPKNAGLQGAILVTSHANGEIVGYVADRDPRFSGFNRILDASRPIGSLMKPAIAITALQNQQTTLGTLLDDTGFKLVFDDGREWQPENYDRTEHGPVLLNTALAHSYNLAFARLGIDTGVPDVLATLKVLGVERVPEPYPATLLGALNLTPYEVTQLYQNILGGGFAVPLRSIRAVGKADGTLASRYLYKTKQVVSPEIAYLVQHALVSVVREGTARHLYSRIPRDIILGGKTGTTNENRDSWFVGFDGKYLASVWLGKDDNSLTSLTGASGALRVWEDLFVRQGAESWTPVQPESVTWFFVEEGSGKLSAEGCPGAVRLPFISGTEPQEKSVCASEGKTIDSIKRWWQGVFE